MTFLEWLVAGSYLFTATVAAAGLRGFFYLYRLVTNHWETRFRRLERRVADLEDGCRPGPSNNSTSAAA